MMKPVTTDTDPAPKRGRPPKGAPQLSRAAIVEATLTVIDSDGIDGVSMRAVGRQLGVDAKSLYNHVEGKDGLLDAVTEHLLAQIAIPPSTGRLRTDLRAIADAFRTSTLAHPAAAPLVLTRQLSSFEGLAPIEAVLTTLTTAGCPPTEAVHLLRSLVAGLIGTLLREVSAGPTFGTTDLPGIAHRESVLQGSGLPMVAASAAHLARFDGHAEYEFVVSLLLDALEARLAGS